MTHPNAQLITQFYAGFNAHDGARMTACYHPQIVFSDPVFGRLEGPRAAAMWQMLCGRARDLAVEVSQVRADDQRGTAHWEARYSFGKAARPVHNVIEAAFVFRDGLIAEHADTFDLYRWARMALGPAGWLLGWTPMMRAGIRRNALGGLEEFLAKKQADSPA